jgi:hypothetical protein
MVCRVPSLMTASASRARVSKEYNSPAMRFFALDHLRPWRPPLRVWSRGQTHRAPGVAATGMVGQKGNMQSLG